MLSFINKLLLLVLCFTLQSCNKYYSRDSTIESLAESEIYKLIIFPGVVVEEASGGSFTDKPYKAKFMPGKYSLNLSAAASYNGKTYYSYKNTVIDVNAKAGRTAHLYLNLRDNTFNLVDVTVWLPLNKYMEFTLTKEKHDDVMFNYYTYSPKIDETSYNRAMYHLSDIYTDRILKHNAIEYLQDNIMSENLSDEDRLAAMYALGLYYILLASTTESNNKLIKKGLALYSKALSGNYRLAIKNQYDINDITNKLNSDRNNSY